MLLLNQNSTYFWEEEKKREGGEKLIRLIMIKKYTRFRKQRKLTRSLLSVCDRVGGFPLKLP